MLYLARLLHMPDGGLERNILVDVFDGRVNKIYPFAGEAQSMLFVDDIFLSDKSSRNPFHVTSKIPHPEEGEGLCAYALDSAGLLVLLE